MKLSFIVTVLFFSGTSWFCIDVSALTPQQHGEIKQRKGSGLSVSFHEDAAVETKHGQEGGMMKTDDETTDENGKIVAGQDEVKMKHRERGGLTTKSTRAKILGDLKLRRTLQDAGELVQIGSDIDGEAAGDSFGYSVSTSRDGNRVAIGALYNGDGGDRSGHVRIYEWNSSLNGWKQLGSDINGETAGYRLGFSVSMSGDGNKVAIGSPGDNNDGNSKGHVRIYEWESSDWKQVGNDIVGMFANTNNHHKHRLVSMSTDGNRVAVSDALADNYGPESGQVRIYEWKSTDLKWLQLGGPLNANKNNDHVGSSLSMSSDGNRVAIGALLGDSDGKVNNGWLRVFDYNSNSGSWTQIGRDIYGEASHDGFGHSASMSSDGNRVAIGANWNDGGGLDSGHVRVYELNSGDWRQIGNDIDGEASGDAFGYSVSMSSDGNKLAIGAPYNDGNRTSSEPNGFNSGLLRIYEWTSESTWTQIGYHIGEVADDYVAYRVSMSGDGSRVAISSRNINDGLSGRVAVYGFLAPTASPTTPPTSAPTASPTVSPFSWTIDPLGNWTATFDDNSAGNELKGKYKMTVGRRFDFKVLQPDCKNQIGVVDAIKYVSPTRSVVPDSGVVEASIGISMDRLSDIEDQQVYLENFKDGIDKIEICIKGSLLVPGTDDTSVNFHETILTILVDKAQDLIIDIETERTAATNTTDNVAVAYKVDPFICAGGELNNSSTWLEANSSYSQGDPLKVCLRAPSTEGVNLDKVTKFELEQVTGGSAGKSVMIGDNNDVMAGGILANSQCTKNACMIQSMIPAKYFDDIDDGTPYNLKAGGDIVLKFGERRLKGVLVDSSSIGRSGAISRGLQSEESAVSSSFEVSVGLKGENMVEDDGREVSAANPIFAGRLPVLLSFVGAVLFTGVALVN